MKGIVETKESAADNVNQQEEIRRRAYELYEQRGRADGFDLEDWAQAEAEILGSKQIAKAA